MTNSRLFIWLLISTISISLIGYVFWSEQIKFLTPTPRPNFVKKIGKGEKAPLSIININSKLKRPLLIHFYNPFCPCSKFNLKEFKKMTFDYNGKIDFLLIAQTDKEIPNLKDEISSSFFNKIEVSIDENGKIAEEFGIYSSPQVVIVDQNGYIFYKGNYNSARYCTNKQTAFAEISINDLLNKRATQTFNKSATVPYGCVLPSYN